MTASWLKSLAIGMVACLSLAACSDPPPQSRGPGDQTAFEPDEPPGTKSAAPTPEEIAAQRAAAEIAYCPRLRKNIARGECDRIEGLWKNMERGEAAMNVPPDMVRDEPSRVTFAIAGTNAEETAREIVGKGANVQTFATKVGGEMAAELTGEGFKISPAGPVTKDLGAPDAERWEWDVTPVKARHYRLTVKAYVVIPAADGTPRNHFLKSFDQEASVRVTGGQRVGDWMDDSAAWFQRGNNWLKALAGLLTALGAVIVAVRSLRAKPKPAQ